MTAESVSDLDTGVAREAHGEIREQNPCDAWTAAAASGQLGNAQSIGGRLRTKARIRAQALHHHIQGLPGALERQKPRDPVFREAGDVARIVPAQGALAQ